MRIAYFSAGDENFASSRLRVHKIAAELRKLEDVEVVINGYPWTSDVIVVQKRIDLYSVMQQAKEQGIRVVYDVDDCMPNLIDPSEVDVITVDTAAKLELYPGAVVVPDCLDVSEYHPQKSVHTDNVTHLVWTGNADNLYHMANVAQACRDLCIVWTVVTDLQSPVFMETIRPWAKDVKGWMQCIQWNKDSVDRILVPHDLFVAPFMFDGKWSSEWVKSKSANRILKAWALGLPVAGTAIPAYTEAGLRYQAQTVEEWRDILTQLQDPVLRAQDARRGSDIAQQFTADKVAKQWLEVFRG